MRFSKFVSLAAVVSALTPASATPNTSTSKVPCTKSVRKEWRDLADREKKAYIDAVKCLGNLPRGSNLKPTGATPDIPALNPNSSVYDDFVYAHMDSNIKDHFTALFLPWHRWFLHTFEKALKSKCGYKGTHPYWDFSRDASSGIPNSPVFNSSTTHGLGTFGTDPANNYTVMDGAFANVTRVYPSPRWRVQRHFDNTPFEAQVFPFAFSNPTLIATDTVTPAAIDAVVMGNRGNYTGMAYAIDGVRAQGMHNAAHLMLGGDMSNPFWSPNDPLFWLLHANVDRIWARWQANYSENKFAYGGGLTQDLANYDRYPVGAPPKANKYSKLPTEGLSAPVKVIEVLDTQNAYLCYKYAD